MTNATHTLTGHRVTIVDAMDDANGAPLFYVEDDDRFADDGHALRGSLAGWHPASHIARDHPATLVVMSCEGPGVAYSLRYPSVSAAVAQLETLAAGTFGEVRDDVTGETYTLA